MDSNMTGWISFQATDDALIVANGGEDARPFDRLGVISICHLGISPKVAKPPRDNYMENGVLCANHRLPTLIAERLQNADANIRGSLASAAKQTSADCTGRFELELLQNADDAIGDRTTSELIGAKGMGFKSVLEITDSPEIHSGEFHFQLARKQGEDELRIPNVINDAINAPQGAATVLRLPYRDESAKQTVIDLLNNITPELMLFMQRLSRINIEINGDAPRVLEINRGASTGFGSETCTLTENNTATKWRRWTAPWSVDNKPKEQPGKQMSVSLCLPLGNDGKPVAAQQEYPLCVFFPTKGEIPGLKALLHASYEVSINRDHISPAASEHDRKAIREKACGLIADVLTQISPETALRAFGSIRAPSTQKGEITQLQKAIRDTVTATAFVPVVGGSLVKPGEARLWRHDLGNVVRESHKEVCSANLLSSMLAREHTSPDIRKILDGMGAKIIGEIEHAKLLRFCKNDGMQSCAAALRTAESIVAKNEECAGILKQSPLWLTESNTPRAINGAMPLLWKRPKIWPEWLDAEFISPELRGAIAPASREKDNNKLPALKSKGVWPLDNSRAFLSDALLPFCRGKDAKWWAEHGWDVLRMAIQWAGADGKTTNKKVGDIIHLPTDKGWMPANNCYAGGAWGGPATFGKYFNNVENRGVIVSPSKWRKALNENIDREKLGKVLRGFGVSWSPKIRNISFCERTAPSGLAREYAYGRLKSIQEYYVSAHSLAKSENNIIEHFPGALNGCKPVDVFRAMQEIPDRVHQQIRIEYFYHGSRRGFDYCESFAMFQLRRCKWVPCHAGLHQSNKNGRVMTAPEDAFMPGQGIRGITPMVVKPGMPAGEWHDVYNTLQQLGVKEEIPPNTEKSWWRGHMEELATTINKRESGIRWLREKKGMAAAISTFYRKFHASLEGMGDVPFLHKVNNVEFVNFAPLSDVRWADKPYHETVRGILLDNDYKLLPFHLNSGKPFGVQPLSESITERLICEEEWNLKDAESVLNRLNSRKAMLALVTGKRHSDFDFFGNIRGYRRLRLALAKQGSDKEIASPEVEFYIGDKTLFVNIGGSEWRALSAGIVQKLGIPAEKANVLYTLLHDADEKECRAWLQSQGISEDEIVRAIQDSKVPNDAKPAPENNQNHPPKEDESELPGESAGEECVGVNITHSPGVTQPPIGEQSSSVQHTGVSDVKSTRTQTGQTPRTTAPAQKGTAIAKTGNHRPEITQEAPSPIGEGAEPLTTENMEVALGPPPPTIHSSDIGRWAEKMLFAKLQEKHGTDAVVWENETTQNNPGFDFTVQTDRGDLCIELKHRKSRPKKVALTKKERMHAQEKGKCYHLYVSYPLGDVVYYERFVIPPAAWEASEPNSWEIRLADLQMIE